MNDETKQCQNCKTDFVIEKSDFDFYKKMKVPAPTFCPECRMIRRIAYRNERSLYHDKCDLCEKSMLSMYAPESPHVVYCKECWYSDKWDASIYGQEYNWDKSFFEQFAELRLEVPRLGLLHVKDNVQCDYSNYIGHNKNVYLGFSIVRGENIMYSRAIDDSRDTVDCSSSAALELCYECIECGDDNHSQYLFRVASSINCAFLYDCANCQDCFMSVGLRSKRYIFRNKQLTKEQYAEEMKKIDLGSRSQIDELKKGTQGNAHAIYI